MANDTIYCNRNKGLITAGLFFNMTMTFEIIIRTLLLNKLKRLKFGDNIYWFHSSLKTEPSKSITMSNHLLLVNGVQVCRKVLCCVLFSHLSLVMIPPLELSNLKLIIDADDMLLL